MTSNWFDIMGVRFRSMTATAHQKAVSELERDWKLRKLTEDFKVEEDQKRREMFYD